MLVLACIEKCAFRLPWYSMYIRYWPLRGQEEQSEPDRLETGNLQDLQVLPCWLTENLLSTVSAAFTDCCSKLTCNTSNMDVNLLHFFHTSRHPTIHDGHPKSSCPPLLHCPLSHSCKVWNSQVQSFLNSSSGRIFFFFSLSLFPFLSCKISCQCSAWNEFLQQSHTTSENRYLHWKAWHTLYGACEWQNHNQKRVKTPGRASSIQLGSEQSSPKRRK